MSDPRYNQPTDQPERTLEQRRAADALCKTMEIHDAQPPWASSYRSYVDSLPAGIVMNGLGQALATELASAGAGDEDGGDAPAHERLFQNVATWLVEQIAAYDDPDRLLADIMNHSEQDYLHAQAEALAWLNWHKKFCRAYLRSRGDDR